MPTVTTARMANTETCELGEGPVWDAARNRLLWVDIRRGLVLVGELREEAAVEIVDRVAFAGTVGAVAVAESGDWLVAGGEELLIRSADGAVTRGPRLLPAGSGRRLNDGRPDPAGRFVVGSLCLDGESRTEVLVRLDEDGGIRTLDDDLTLSNGLAWSADGTRMYSVDTMRRTVFARSYDPATGRVGDRAEFLHLEDGFPDGMCLDAEEHLWIAMWGLGQVRRYSPGGELIAIIDVPAPHTSSIAFAGPDLDLLVITTATQDLTATQLAEFPESGRLFITRPGVRGLRQAPWNGLGRQRQHVSAPR
jgi:sugar lactone lactonase YvrE